LEGCDSTIELLPRLFLFYTAPTAPLLASPKMDMMLSPGGLMTKTNMARVVLGGILAGLILNILGFLVDGILLAPQWNAGMSALGRSGEITMNQIVGFNILGFCYGIAVVWLYAAIRPRYGAGPKTAVTAGLALWVGGVLLPNVGFMSVNGLFPVNLTIMTTLGAIVECVAAALAGAAVYKESAEPARSSMAARA
jgi:hypothetical protein